MLFARLLKGLERQAVKPFALARNGLGTSDRWRGCGTSDRPAGHLDQAPSEAALAAEKRQRLDCADHLAADSDRVFRRISARRP